MNPPTPRLTVATLAELESTTGFEWFVTAPRNELTFPERFRELMYRSRKELRALEPQLPRVSTLLQRRFLKHSAWVADVLGNFDEAATFQRRLGNIKEADWQLFQASMARGMASFLKPNQIVGALEPLDVHQGVWVALSFVKEVEEQCQPSVLVARKSGGNWQCLAQRTLSPQATNAHLKVLSGEIVIVQDRLGGSWQPTEVNCYRLHQGALQETTSLFSEHGVRLRKFDGRWTLSTFHCIGYCPCHGEQPRWLEVFQQGKNGWQLASAKYPELFEDYPRQIRSLLKRYPNDDVLPAYLHWTERLLQGKTVGPPPQKHAQKIDT
ncbi:hypothetical protein [Armatimonas rosea]|uniref:Uncharacterized protein n=1 Tax=Armatimonas rosea TaxID=685828 RepID=A0A7W9SSN6_ARMRO|nr:hypothetical protein [Armatimonas rosea]MBB6051996.1 hypothetical protein [Armatimonas rosea]